MHLTTIIADSVSGALKEQIFYVSRILDFRESIHSRSGFTICSYEPHSFSSPQVHNCVRNSNLMYKT